MFPLGKVYTGDCVNLMNQLPPDYIDLTVTSPPYDNLRKYNGYSFDFESTAKQLYRITKPGGTVVWVVGDATIKGSETGTSFKQTLYFMQCGFWLNSTMIFRKTNAFPTDPKYRYNKCFEYMFILTKGRPKIFNPLTEPTLTKRKYKANWGRDKNDAVIVSNTEKTTKELKIRSGIWEYAIGPGGTTNDCFTHKAMFPEKLAEDHILSWSNPYDLVFDPFSGSGTTGKMALLNNRKFLGFEISEEYTTLANNRIHNAVYDGL